MKKFLYAYITLLSLQVQAQSPSDTLVSKARIQEFVVHGIKANAQMPVTQLTLHQKELEYRYYGADLPSVFNFTPSVNVYSDNGTGIGYSYFRMRGLDQTRINITLNGIPVNDQESQGSYFNNFADLASSGAEIQIQRGVGTSTNGTASLGGSVNILTKSLAEKPEISLYTGFGSFNSRRLTAECQTGILDNHTAFYARVSDLSTNGYRYNSGSHIQSMFLSGGWFGKKSVLKLNVLAGLAGSELSYSGIDKATMDADRRTNPFVHKERDAFTQNFFQAQYTCSLRSYSGISASVYYVYGNAPRFQYFLDGSYNTFQYMNMPDAIVGSDTVTTTDALGSYRLNQQFVGGFATYFYRKGAIDFTTGIHANRFVSEHFMEVNWARVLPAGIDQDHQAYFNTGYKSELSAFVKLNYALTGSLNWFVDLQLRNARFSYKGKDGTYHRDTFSVEDMSWIFVNPKTGFRYTINSNWSAYVMYGMTTREPTRSDYFLDEYPHQNIRQNDIQPERVGDLELGINYRSAKWMIQANVFNMDFTNQLVNTGQLNAVGTPVTTNVASSYRRGVEFDVTWKVIPKLWLLNNTSMMQSRIADFTQYFDSAGAYTTYIGLNYKNSTPLLTPNWIVNQGMRVFPVNWISFDLIAHLVSQQFLDNTSNEQLTLPAFSFVNAKLEVSLGRWIKTGTPTLSVQVNNLTDARFSTSGNTTGYVLNYDANGVRTIGTTALYFPAATRNFFVTLGWKF